MKVRIKFTKEGPVKFLGHLDTMRYFQKAIRRAALPAAFSGGFSPHMIMSFAAPLGVGIESEGEYFDLELAEAMPSAEIEKRLNSAMAEGFSVVSVRRVEDGKAGKAMSLVAAADYLVNFREGKEPFFDWKGRAEDFFARESIIVIKKTKSSEKEVDIRPFIYEAALRENGIFLRLASASSNYTKPELVMDAFLRWTGKEPEPFSYKIRRLEVYGEDPYHDGKFITLEALGERVE